MSNYELSLKVDFRVVIDSTPTDKSGTINLWIKLTSRIETADSGSILKLQATDRFDNLVPLYSGAKNQLLSLPNIYSGSGTIENVEFTISLPSGFGVDSKVAAVEIIDTSYYYSEDPLWLLRDAGANDKAASIRSGTFKVTYTHSGTSVTERDVPIKIEIAQTPMLTLDGQIDESDIGTTTGGLYESNVQINQGTSTKTFSLLFKNEGNVDLKDVDVELYTDDAAYFFKSNFYYDESDHAYKRSFGNVVKLGDLYKGQIVKKEFSADMINNLPPGLYRIPIKYSAQYNTGGLIDVDLDVGDYHKEIVEARSQYNEGYEPFLLVDVSEGESYQDYNEPDLLAVSNTNLRPGMRNVQLTVELTNLENYKITSVNPMIEAGSGSPIKALNSVNDTVMKINSIETDFIMFSANDPTFSNK
ncbi:MAG: hypothetical protein KAJ51_01875, partial [Thermoplasmata archaeon]|nr:hypothetical protein [Thermoplasmata archaeon]